MESSIQPQNPYLADPSAEWIANRNANTSPQPRWLKPIAIISMVVGTLGFGGGVMSTLSLIFQEAMQKLMQQFMGANAAPPGSQQAKMDAAINQMQQSMVTMHQEHWFILQFFYLFAMVSGAYLFWCALAVLRNNPLGSSKLRQAFIVAIAYLALSVLLGLYMYFETKPIMDRYLEDVVSTVPPAASAIMRTSVKIGTNVALVAQIAFLVIKIVLYLLGIVYLGKVAKQMQTQDSANPATAPAA